MKEERDVVGEGSEGGRGGRLKMMYRRMASVAREISWNPSERGGARERRS